MALDRLESIPVAQRDFSALTFLIGKRKISRFRKILDKFQNDILDLSNNSFDEEVYIFASQLFPVKK
jgi:hypothetical protein